MKAHFSWPVIALPVAVLVVLSPFLFFGYSISQGDVANDFTQVYRDVRVLGVADPGHSGLLAEPYLPELKQHLLQGRVPLLNMKNGLGSGGVESLLDSSFYLLNPVLLLLPTDRPIYYDLFQILHVCILLAGLYALLRKYGSPFTAVTVAILVTFSGVTYVWINLDIYRNFAWAPWMVFAAVSLARGDQPRKNAWLLVFAIIASITAGNVLETTMDLYATCIVFCCELAAQHKVSRLRTLRTLLLALTGAALATMFSVLPYLFSTTAKNLYSSNMSTRSVEPYDIIWLFTILIPKVTGFFPYLFLRHQPFLPHADLSTAACFLIVAGVSGGLSIANRTGRKAHYLVSAVLPAVMLVGYLKIVNFPPLRFVQHIPLFSSIWFVKYYLYLYVLAAILMAIGLEALVVRERSRRVRLIVASSIIITLLLLSISVYLSLRPDYNKSQEIPKVVQQVAQTTWAISIGVWLLLAGVLWLQPKFWQPAIVGLAIFQGLALLPPGYGKRVERYPSRVTAGFEPQYRGKRMLLRTRPNENLYSDTESIGVYDASVNAHYKNFMNAFFPLANGFCNLEISDITLQPTQVQALELIGTEAIQGYRVADNKGSTTKLGTGLDYLISHPLPRLYLIKQETFDRLNTVPIGPISVNSALTLIRADLAQLPQPTISGIDGTTFQIQLPPNARGKLVLNQAFSPYWKVGPTYAKPFLDLFPSWPITETTTSTQTIHYWPTGLTYGLWLWFPAAAMLVAMHRSALSATHRRRVNLERANNTP